MAAVEAGLKPAGTGVALGMKDWTGWQGAPGLLGAAGSRLKMPG